MVEGMNKKMEVIQQREARHLSMQSFAYLLQHLSRASRDPGPTHSRDPGPPGDEIRKHGSRLVGRSGGIRMQRKKKPHTDDE
ncbi:phosphatidylcholine:ceramide cholinephosphotransferase 2 [Anopheles sinensis]|uniref:Phosphatidylcholine:ceramide cholinephosphotransferase 2 n=1 Tax=Anopheles sinensis TaxID=74873 RepID=A0A084VQG5_ANOSI|nr:phosphatidylcholine:ceramide cholinephosphotransferase 2 [Anopheles sinensis]